MPFPHREQQPSITQPRDLYKLGHPYFASSSPGFPGHAGLHIEGTPVTVQFETWEDAMGADESIDCNIIRPFSAVKPNSVSHLVQ